MKNEITVEKLENGKIYICKRLDDDPLGMALGAVIPDDNAGDIGEALMEMLNSK